MDGDEKLSWGSSLLQLWSGRDSAKSKNESSQIILKMPGGEVIDPREEKIPHELFPILTSWCPKRLFSKNIEFECELSTFWRCNAVFILTQ